MDRLRENILKKYYHPERLVSPMGPRIYDFVEVRG